MVAAAPGLKLGQLISATPGIMSISRKRRLVPTLRAAYEDKANEIVPLSFALPGELSQFEEHLEQCGAAGREPGMWMLKTSQHLGKGLSLLPPDQALLEAKRGRWAAAAASASHASPMAVVVACIAAVTGVYKYWKASSFPFLTFVLYLFFPP